MNLVIQDLYQPVYQPVRTAIDAAYRATFTNDTHESPRLLTLAEVNPSPAQPDPLIDHRGDWLIYIGLALLVALLGWVVRLLSGPVEYALLFALSLSFVLILLMLTL